MKIRTQNRGMAVITMLALFLIFAVVAISVVTTVGNSLRSTNTRGSSTEALNIAEAGVDLTLIWLQSQSGPPDSASVLSLTNFFGTNGTIDNPFGQTGTRLSVKIYGDATNVGPIQKHYLVESTGTMPNGVAKTVRAFVQQVSFGKYAFFADIDSDGFWDYHNHFEGPFHSNCSDGLNSRFLYTVPAPDGPIFQYTGEDAFSSSRDVTWWKDSLWNAVNPSSADDFNALSAGGQTSMNYGWKVDPSGNLLLDSGGNRIPKSAPIALPTTDYQQSYVALGLTPPSNPTSLPATVPTTTGVTVTAGGGLYVHGPSKIVMSQDNSGNQVFKITTDAGLGISRVQTVTVNSSTNATTTQTQTVLLSGVVTSTSTATVSGVPNGMLFSDDNITSLSGTVADNTVDGSGNIVRRNQWTIATDTGAGKDVTLSDSIRYNTSRDLNVAQAADTSFNRRGGTLGIMARDVVVTDGAPAQIEFDCAIFCTGSFKAANPTNLPGQNGRMKEVGGVIVQRSGIFAYADNTGNLVSGWNEEYHYDSRLADYPPPYFPTTGNHYSVVSWQTITSPIP